MQAGKTKTDRKQSAAARAAARLTQRQLRRGERTFRRGIKRLLAQKIKDGRKEYAAMPTVDANGVRVASHIEKVKAAYNVQCRARREEKAAEREAKRQARAKATTPAEAASNETR